MDIFSRDWNLVITLGIKCNIAPILTRVGKRYTSSPFDNMDSVEGLVEAGELIASKFEGYFEDKSRWRVRNHYARDSSVISAKVISHEKYPNLYFPHFYQGWFDSETASKIADWIKDPEGSLDMVWEGLKATYSRRQTRLVKLLSSENKILFLRAEDRSQLQRLRKRNLIEDLKAFDFRISHAFPMLDYGFIYFSCEQEFIKYESSEAQQSNRIQIMQIPSTVSEPEFIEQKLKKINVFPRELVAAEHDL